MLSIAILVHTSHYHRRAQFICRVWVPTGRAGMGPSTLCSRAAPTPHLADAADLSGPPTTQPGRPISAGSCVPRLPWSRRSNGPPSPRPASGLLPVAAGRARRGRLYHDGRAHPTPGTTQQPYIEDARAAPAPADSSRPAPHRTADSAAP